MKRIIATICILFIAAVSFSQNDYLLGTWKFEKIADDQNLDEQSLKLANEMFANMTITFEAKFYSQSFMGKTETGTYSFLKKNKYEFFSSKGYNYKVEIEKIDDTHMTFRFSGKAYQMKKLVEEKPETIEKVENSLDKIDGVEVTEAQLIGKWYYAGQVKDGVENNFVFVHSENEKSSYTFLENGKFENKAPLEMTFEGKWKIKEDKKTLVIESKNKTEFFKITKIGEYELEIYNPKTETILKFTN